jgi:hypothetical protein
LLEARLALEIDDKISLITNNQFKDIFDDTACVMQRIKEAEHAQIRAHAPNKSSLGKTLSSDQSPIF